MDNAVLIKIPRQLGFFPKMVSLAMLQQILVQESLYFGEDRHDYCHGAKVVHLHVKPHHCSRIILAQPPGHAPNDVHVIKHHR